VIIFGSGPGLEIQMVENIEYIDILIMFIKHIESDDSVYFGLCRLLIRNCHCRISFTALLFRCAKLYNLSN
jgi:hypothetical protein